VHPIYVVVGAGLLLGLLVGRWGALTVPVVLGITWAVWMAAHGGDFSPPEEDAPGGVAGLIAIFVLLGLAGAWCGVIIRRSMRRSRAAGSPGPDRD
jgi:uncharacterized membrane protein YhhN